jgi:uncharacterized protein with von Willebrand factor type A (vWA) domain
LCTNPIPRFENPQLYRNAIALCLENPQLSPKDTFKKFISKISSRKQKQKLRDLVEEAENDRLELIQLLQREGKMAVEIAVAYASTPAFEEVQIRKMLREAIVVSNNKLTELEDWLAMLGISWGNEPASDRQVNINEKLELVQKIASIEQLKQIARLAGRFRETAERKYRSIAKDAYGEIASVELGNNLWRLLPGELQKLTDPNLFPLFAKGYYDRSLLQYQFKGKEKQNRGPIIVCLDSSGSMYGLRDTWAKATAAVLLQIAERDNRHFRVIHFAIRVCRVDDFSPGAKDYSKLLELMLSFYAGGGTNWEAALVKAIECIEQQQDYARADIVMITDGLCNVSQSFEDRLKQLKERWQFSIYGVLIDEGLSPESNSGVRYKHLRKPQMTRTCVYKPREDKTSQERLNKFCDRLWVISNLHAEDIVIEELFEL